MNIFDIIDKKEKTQEQEQLQTKSIKTFSKFVSDRDFDGRLVFQNLLYRASDLIVLKNLQCMELYLKDYPTVTGKEFCKMLSEKGLEPFLELYDAYGEKIADDLRNYGFKTVEHTLAEKESMQR